MKKINLLPEDELRRRGYKKYRKYAAGFLSLFIIVGIGFQYDIGRLENKKENMDLKITEFNKTEKKIEIKKGEVLDLNKINFELKYDNIPINNLLYFLGKKLPKDIQLFEVISSNVLKEELKNESTVQDATADKTNVENKENNTLDKNKDSSSENSDKKDSVSEKLANSDNNEDIKVNQNGEYLVFRGSALKFDDIADLTLKLEELEYFANVDIIDVQSYYNGFQTYNIFEIQAKLAY